MAIANGTCVSFCNRPKAQFGYLGRVTRYVVVFTSFADGGIWLPQESLRHRYGHSYYRTSLAQRAAAGQVQARHHDVTLPASLSSAVPVRLLHAGRVCRRS